MSEAVLIELQDFLDTAIAAVLEKYSLNFLKRSPEIDKAHRVLIENLWLCSEGKRARSDVRTAFRNWIDLLKCKQAEAMMISPTDESYSEGRLCFSLGCLGFVKYLAGKGKCSTCGLHQVLLKEEFLCTSTSYSKSEMMIPVVSLAERRRLKQAANTRKPLENAPSLF